MHCRSPPASPELISAYRRQQQATGSLPVSRQCILMAQARLMRNKRQHVTGDSTSLPIIAPASAAPGNDRCMGTPVSTASCPAGGTHQSSACAPALSCHQQQALSSAPCVARARADMHAAKGSSTASQTGPSAGGGENQSPVVGTDGQPRPAKRRPPASFAAQQDARPQAAAVGAHARPGRRRLPASLAASASGGSSSSVLKPLQLPQARPCPR